MINSRSLFELLDPVRLRAQALLDACARENIDLLVTSTFRDQASQAYLYAQGRTRPGKIITNAGPGQSLHQYRVAFDVVPLRAGKPVWGTKGADGKLWHRAGQIGESVGLEWAGRWLEFREYPHFQYTGGLTLTQLTADEVPT